MSRKVWLILFGLVILGTSGCSGSSKKGPPPKSAVKGTVTLDGKPVPEGEILFSVSGEVPVPLPIKDGSFSGEATVGKNAVSVSVYKAGKPTSTDPKTPTKINIIPAKYNGPNTTLSADVAEGGANDFKFAVTSK